LASAYAQLDRYSDAVHVAEEVVKLTPDDLKAHYFLALLYSELKENGKAFLEYENIFKMLAEQEPDNWEFPMYLGQLYYAAGYEQKAMDQFELALKLNPGDTDLLYVLGTYYLERSRRSEGVQLLKQCLDIQPVNPDCLNSLAYSYAEDNTHLEEALKYINAALVVAPGNAAYLDTKGWVYYRQGRYDHALKELMQADRLLKDPTILEHIAEVYLKLGKPGEAERFQKERVQVLNNNAKKSP